MLYWCQDNINNVIRDCVKSSEMVAKAADVLRRHGFQEESRFLAGKHFRPSSICLCYVCFTVEPPSITVH